MTEYREIRFDTFVAAKLGIDAEVSRNFFSQVLENNGIYTLLRELTVSTNIVFERYMGGEDDYDFPQDKGDWELIAIGSDYKSFVGYRKKKMMDLNKIVPTYAQKKTKVQAKVSIVLEDLQPLINVNDAPVSLEHIKKEFTEDFGEKNIDLSFQDKEDVLISQVLGVPTKELTESSPKIIIRDSGMNYVSIKHFFTKVLPDSKYYNNNLAMSHHVKSLSSSSTFPSIYRGDKGIGYINCPKVLKSFLNSDDLFHMSDLSHVMKVENGFIDVDDTPEDLKNDFDSNFPNCNRKDFYVFSDAWLPKTYLPSTFNGYYGVFVGGSVPWIFVPDPEATWDEDKLTSIFAYTKESFSNYMHFVKKFALMIGMHLRFKVPFDTYVLSLKSLLSKNRYLSDTISYNLEIWKKRYTMNSFKITPDKVFHDLMELGHLEGKDTDVSELFDMNDEDNDKVLGQENDLRTLNKRKEEDIGSLFQEDDDEDQIEISNSQSKVSLKPLIEEQKQKNISNKNQKGLQLDDRETKKEQLRRLRNKQFMNDYEQAQGDKEKE